MKLVKFSLYSAVTLYVSACQISIRNVELLQQTTGGLSEQCKTAIASCEEGIITGDYNGTVEATVDGVTKSYHIVCSQEHLDRITALYPVDDTHTMYTGLSENYLIGSDITPDSTFEGIRGPLLFDYAQRHNLLYPDDTINLMDGQGYAPVGLSGEIDGCGKTINNMSIVLDPVNGGTAYSGLTLGWTENARQIYGFVGAAEPGFYLHNLKFVNPHLENTWDNIGAVVGLASDSYSTYTNTTGSIRLEDISITGAEVYGAAYTAPVIGHVALYYNSSSFVAKNIDVTDSIVHIYYPADVQGFHGNSMWEFAMSPYNFGYLTGSLYHDGKSTSDISNISIDNITMLDEQTAPFNGMRSTWAMGLIGDLSMYGLSDININNVSVNGTANLTTGAGSMSELVGYIQAYGASKLTVDGFTSSMDFTNHAAWAVGMVGEMDAYEHPSLSFKNITRNSTFNDDQNGGAYGAFAALYVGDYADVSVSNYSSSGSINVIGDKNPDTWSTSYAIAPFGGELEFEYLSKLTVSNVFMTDTISMGGNWAGSQFIASLSSGGDTTFTNILYNGSLTANYSISTGDCIAPCHVGSGAIGSAFGYLQVYNDTATNFLLENAAFLGTFTIADEAYDYGGLIGESDLSTNFGMDIIFKNVLVKNTVTVGSEFSGYFGTFMANANGTEQLKLQNVILANSFTIADSTKAPTFGFYGQNGSISATINGTYYLKDTYTLPAGYTGIDAVDSALAVTTSDMITNTSSFPSTYWTVTGSSIPTLKLAE